ncbi:hypothetical protein C4J85_3506 [Pseudomonas sp. R4-34-07]|uniref:2OG-Fe(II) oxygenase family protein n=1 Tax=Pseudomonas sp. R4-34-07 TaxID=658642 RepID=UPI000F56C060|nr:2OG-Fe(II) oxygenase family protein [Pseudomonas sp. R4-34-07]AZF53984.1 hypothetical protein C4J85_3506 [Pseudomonas sp. R4-34-07]
MNKKSQCFRERGYCSIDLCSRIPDLVHGCKDACASIEEQDWTYIIRNSTEEVDLPYSVPHSRLKHAKADALKIYHEGGFAFSFRRLAEIEGAPIHPAMKLFDDYLMRDDFIELLSKLSERTIGAMEARYISRFDQGDFLTTHCDPGSNLGIALNITPQWNPNFGGLTFILNKTHSSVNDTLTPTCGQLFVFDTSQRKVPHFVSMVTANPDQHRIAIIVRYG